MAPTLVTGATGFVGSAVARALADQQRSLRVLVREQSDHSNLAGLDCEIVIGDLNDPTSLQAACADCESVFHVAADYRLWVPDPDSIYRTNVDGTRNLLQAAARAGVRRVVYTSSVATLGLPDSGEAGDESTPVTLDEMIGHYKRSKFQAEQIALTASEQGQHVVIVNPSAPVGPRDRRPTPTGQMIVDAAAGRMPAYVDSGLNIVHVDDVAQGHLLAERNGASGRRYILGGQDMSLEEIFSTVASISGVRPPRIRLPVQAVLPVAYVAEAISRLTGRVPLVTVDGVKLARKHMYFSSQRAQTELGYEPRPAIEALRDAVSWFDTNGYLK